MPPNSYDVTPPQKTKIVAKIEPGFEISVIDLPSKNGEGKERVMAYEEVLKEIGEVQETSQDKK